MQSSLLAFSDRMYHCLMQTYPAAFRERFAEEMAQVFRSLCHEAYLKEGASGVMRLWLPALWDGAWAAVYQWWMRLFNRRVENMETNPINNRDEIRPLSAAQAGAAALPFLIFGIASLLTRLEFFHIYPASLPLWQILFIHPYLFFNWIILLGLGVGILAGFPRWAYSFLSWALLFAWWWTDMGFYGHRSDWRIWLPLLGVFLATLSIRRSFTPLRALFAGLWKDWTLLSFSVYILYGFGDMLYDENHHPYLLVFIAATTIAISLGAWGYFRSVSPLRRILALMGGMFFALVLSWINYSTWDYRAYYGLPESAQKVNLIGLTFSAVLVLLMLGNGLLARWRLSRGSHMKGT